MTLPLTVQFKLKNERIFYNRIDQYKSISIIKEVGESSFCVFCSHFVCILLIASKIYSSNGALCLSSFKLTAFPTSFLCVIACSFFRKTIHTTVAFSVRFFFFDLLTTFQSIEQNKCWCSLGCFVLILYVARCTPNFLHGPR